MAGKGKRGALKGKRVVLKIQRIEDATRALDLRKQGYSRRQIADTLGCSVSKVHEMTSALLAAYPVENVRQLRELECEKLDESELGLMAIRAKFQELSAGGDRKAAEIVGLMEARLSAVRTQRAKLLGANAPEVLELETRTAGEQSPADLRRAMQGLFAGNVGPRDDVSRGN